MRVRLQLLKAFRPALVAMFSTVFTAGSLPADEPSPKVAHWLTPQAWTKDTDGPIVSLGQPGEFDDMHIFAPTVALEDGDYSLWYCGSRGTRSNRVFRLGLAAGTDGVHFEKSAENPVLQFDDGVHSVLTPSLLKDGDGNALRENNRLRMWLSSTAFGKTGLHTLHETTSTDGTRWDKPSEPLLDHCYCPTVLKNDTGYQLWYVDVSRRPWVIRYATSEDGRKWDVREKPVLEISQPWEAEIVVYPCVLKVDGTFLMWYGSYNHAVRRQTTAIGFAASEDGIHWHKHPQNPVLLPDVNRLWESNYVTSGSVMRLADGSFRFWYASRKAPPFENLYFAINTARWGGPPAAAEKTDSPQQGRLPLPPQKDDLGSLGATTAASDKPADGMLTVLEVIDADEAIVRAWYLSADGEPRFADLWVQGPETSGMTAGQAITLAGQFRVTGNQSFGTTCGGRSVPRLERVGQ